MDAIAVHFIEQFVELAFVCGLLLHLAATGALGPSLAPAAQERQSRTTQTAVTCDTRVDSMAAVA